MVFYGELKFKSFKSTSFFFKEQDLLTSHYFKPSIKHDENQIEGLMNIYVKLTSCRFNATITVLVKLTSWVIID